MANIRRIAVITGDHHLPDSTKRGSRYNEEDLVTHNAMCAAFRTFAEFEFTFHTDHAKFLDDFRQSPPDLVVNFCDTGYRNVPTQEIHVPAFLEMLGIPYTGAPPAAMILCFDKQIVRLVAEALDVAVPSELYWPAQARLDDVPEFYPALIKPNTADGSVGITQRAVVHDRHEAIAYLRWLRETLPGRDALIQEYLPGPEYGIGLIGNPAHGLQALPAMEVDFGKLPAGLAPILAYESKALPDSPYWTDIGFKRATLPAEAEAGLVAHARLLFQRFGLRDYARFDFRTGADGVIKLMEVNPNPAWANDGKLAFMAGFAGIDYPGMLRLILDAALQRVRD